MLATGIIARLPQKKSRVSGTNNSGTSGRPRNFFSGALQGTHDSPWIPRAQPNPSGKGLVTNGCIRCSDNHRLALTTAHFYNSQRTRLIQRGDYSKNFSFYDYYFHHDGNRAGISRHEGHR